MMVFPIDFMKMQALDMLIKACDPTGGCEKLNHISPLDRVPKHSFNQNPKND
jgi:hypothetical protein